MWDAEDIALRGRRQTPEDIQDLSSYEFEAHKEPRTQGAFTGTEGRTLVLSGCEDWAIMLAWKSFCSEWAKAFAGVQGLHNTSNGQLCVTYYILSGLDHRDLVVCEMVQPLVFLVLSLKNSFYITVGSMTISMKYFSKHIPHHHYFLYVSREYKLSVCRKAGVICHAVWPRTVIPLPRSEVSNSITLGARGKALCI